MKNESNTPISQHQDQQPQAQAPVYPITGNDGNRYREVRAESKTPSGLTNIAIFQREGDDEHEYMHTSFGTFAAMPKGGW